jgi:hypothetical protein
MVDGFRLVSLSGVGATPQQDFLLLMGNVHLSLLKLKIALMPEDLFFVV